MTLGLFPSSQRLESCLVDEEQYLVKALEVARPDSCIDIYFGKS